MGMHPTTSTRGNGLSMLGGLLLAILLWAAALAVTL